MKTLPPLLLFFCLGLWVCAPMAQARRKHHGRNGGDPADLATAPNEPGALPAEAAPEVKPDAPPSVSLQPFVDRHLGTTLAPLGQSAFAQSELLTSLKASYADGEATAPASHKAAYQAAQSVCDALSGAITERQTAVAALRGALASRSSEAEQPRGGGEEVAKAKASDNFFIDSQKNNWLQSAQVLRNNITALYLRERAIERQVGVWSPPPPPPAAPSTMAAVVPSTTAAVVAHPTAATVVAPSTAAAVAPVPAVGAPTPSVSAPAPAANVQPQAPDPVVGHWAWQSYELATVEADHSINGRYGGSWRYLSTTSEGRFYEFDWNHKGYKDYLTLSADGYSLSGKNMKGNYVYAGRK